MLGLGSLGLAFPWRFHIAAGHLILGLAKSQVPPSFVLVYGGQRYSMYILTHPDLFICCM